MPFAARIVMFRSVDSISFLNSVEIIFLWWLCFCFSFLLFDYLLVCLFLLLVLGKDFRLRHDFFSEYMSPFGNLQSTFRLFGSHK